MKKIFFLINVIQFGFIVINIGQSIPDRSIFNTNDGSKFLQDKKENTFICVRLRDTLPIYKFGTNEELIQIIHSQIRYPEESCIQGRTFLVFVVNETGKVESAEIKRSFLPEIDKQLLALIMKYEFEPGISMGKPIKCQMVFPFRFALE
ncbi:MAG: energy transducer TonB [Saprospiraceae bacterium]|nr:energy transducer TonB [Saprospiraceae bacterium]MCB9324919.1 energy transducer TonB [Lewinellaceae bacterium]